MTLPALKTDGVDAFLNAHGGTAGEFVRFSKEAKFVVLSDNTELSEGTRLNCIFDQTQHGWIKFNGVGKPPTRHMGGMFEGYVPPPRSELGDEDPTLWEPGLDGQPQDPWLFQVLLPLQNEETGKLYIFQTSSKTGLRAVTTLISTCKQMAKRESDVWPVVELKVSSFEHRDPRIGKVNKPDFKIVGKVNKSGAPQQIGTGAVLDDEIPF